MLYNVQCSDIGFIVRIIARLLKYLHFLIPILLIVLIIIDMVKVFIGTADDKAKSEAFNKMIKRVIYAVIIFLIPTILFFIFEKIDTFKSTKEGKSNVSATSWYRCFMDEYNK